TAAGPVREAAVARSTAAVAALRGELTAEDIRKLARRKARRARRGRAFKRLMVVGVVAGGVAAVWKWWEKQSNPDWLVEPPAATEVGDEASVMEGTGSAEPKAGATAAQTDTQGTSSEAAPSDEER
ncbi:DUF5324 family protein, partial [Streptomyces atacamensis]|uniref:DUF5324 family protein n=1 Tax=Streptomyces atacamensis TaxID=531966 RepID=UPI00399CE758